MLVGLVIVMLMGTAVYLRLWIIDYTVSSADTELLRFSFIFCFTSFLSLLILPFSCNCKKWVFLWNCNIVGDSLILQIGRQWMSLQNGDSNMINKWRG